jgi:hypothetical protein
VVRAPGNRSRGAGSIPGATRFSENEEFVHNVSIVSLFTKYPASNRTQKAGITGEGFFRISLDLKRLRIMNCKERPWPTRKYYPRLPWWD